MTKTKTRSGLVVTDVRETLPGQYVFGLDYANGVNGDVETITFACFRNRQQALDWQRRLVNWIEEVQSGECRVRSEGQADAVAALRSIAGWGLTIVNMLEADAHISAAARKRGEGVAPDDFDALRTRLSACVRAWIVAPARAAAGEGQNAECGMQNGGEGSGFRVRGSAKTETMPNGNTMAGYLTITDVQEAVRGNFFFSLEYRDHEKKLVDSFPFKRLKSREDAEDWRSRITGWLWNAIVCDGKSSGKTELGQWSNSWNAYVDQLAGVGAVSPSVRLESLQRELADVIIDRDVERELRHKLAVEVAELREQVREMQQALAGETPAPPSLG